MPDKSETPLTDAFLANLDMQDLELGHKYRELTKFAKMLETELKKSQSLTMQTINLAREAINKLK